MEPRINRLLMGCGLAAGLLLGTGYAVEGVALAVVAMLATRLLRAQGDWQGEP